MSLLGDEKASEKRFNITGKFSGGVGSSGTWTGAAGRRFGNDWEAEERAKLNTPALSMTQRLKAAQQKEHLGAGDPNVTVQIPDERASIKDRVTAQVKKAVKKKTAQGILNPQAESEKSRLEGLFSGGASSLGGMATAANQILKQTKR